MSRAAWLNSLLAAAVAALGVWIYLSPSRTAVPEYRLSTLKPSAARSIRIERAAAAPVLLEKRHGAWFLTGPFPARGNETRVRALLEVLEATTPHRLPATDLPRFELAPPRATLIVDGQRFGFGMVSPVAHEQYVLASGSVFAVHPRYGAALPPHAAAMASRSLFAAGETPVRIDAGAFAVEQRDGKWALAPGAQVVSQEALARWVEGWRLASALDVEPHVDGKAPETVRVDLKSGGVLAIGVLAREPRLVLLREDERLAYAFPAEMAKRLLAPPAARAARPAKQ